MTRSLYALVPWMVLATSAYGQTRSADVLYTHYDDVPTHGLRVGEECFVSLEDVERWGWTTETWADTVDIKAEGKSFAVPFRNINGRPCLPLLLAIKKLDGIAEWTPSGDTLSIYGRVTNVSVREGRIQIETTLDVRSTATRLSSPARLALDLVGAKLDGTTKVDVDGSAHFSQLKPSLARIIIDGNPEVNMGHLSRGSVHSIDERFDVTENAVPISTTVPTVPRPSLTLPPIDRSTEAPIVSTTPKESGKLEVMVEEENPNLLRLRVPVGLNSEPIVHKVDPSTVEFVLPGVNLGLDPEYRVATPSVVSMTSQIGPQGTTIRLILTRPMGVEMTRTVDGVHLDFMKPEVGDGKLSGKLIVVDPGHGGKDRGAHTGDVFEKDLNLKIGTLIAAALTKQGATVIMTRKTDVFIPLDERAQIANSNHADLFISNHINSTGGSGSQSGGITFHHLGRPICRILAECIQTEIGKVSGIPNLGAWSDGKIYHSGFSVLRQTAMPGVLLELGFINRTLDRRRMVTDEFQQAIADAVVRGVKVYLGDAKTN